MVVVLQWQGLVKKNMVSWDSSAHRKRIASGLDAALHSRATRLLEASRPLRIKWQDRSSLLSLASLSRDLVEMPLSGAESYFSFTWSTTEGSMARNLSLFRIDVKGLQ